MTEGGPERQPQHEEDEEIRELQRKGRGRWVIPLGLIMAGVLFFVFGLPTSVLIIVGFAGLFIAAKLKVGEKWLIGGAVLVMGLAIVGGLYVTDWLVEVQREQRRERMEERTNEAFQEMLEKARQAQDAGK